MPQNKSNSKIIVGEQHLMEYGKSSSIVKDNTVMGRKSEEENASFGRTILSTLSQYPDFVGMIDAKTGKKVTFAEMRDRSVRCALWLRKQGVGENDVVSLSTPVQMNDYVPYLATLYINAIVNPWPHDAPTGYSIFFEICQPKVMFACEDSIDKLSKVAKDRGIHCKFVTFESHQEHSSLEEIMAEQTQEEIDNFECMVPLEPRKKVSRIIFSSGTTDTPKAIMLPYNGLLTRGADRGLRSGITCLWYSPFAWIAGGNYTVNAIRMVCTRIVHSEFDVEETGSIIEKYKINLLVLRSYLLTLCHQENIFTRYNFEHVSTIIFAGAKMNKAILEKCRNSLPHTIVKGVYGSTETGGMVLTQTTNCKYIDSAGYVCDGVKLKVVDPNTGTVLGPNQEGELCVKTDTATLGYYGNPEETKKIIDEEGWLRMGDLCSYDEEGEFMITGRLKALIKTKSLFISPFEIEEVLMQHPAINDCTVVGVDHPIDIERPFAFVVKAPNAEVTTEELVEFAESKDERYRLTGGLVFIDKLPLTHSGKKCLRELQEMARYLIPWYKLPRRASQVFIIIRERTYKIKTMSVSSLFILSLENFRWVLQALWSIATVFASTHNK